MNKKIPSKYWAQINGKSAQENYKIQKKEIKKRLYAHELEKRMNDEIYLAVMSAMEESANAFEEDVSNAVVNNIESIFEGGGIHPERLNSFSKQLAVGLGRALGSFPFFWLHDIFDDDDDR